MDELELLDYKRAVHALYQAVRGQEDHRSAVTAWRKGRDELLRSHPQSPLPPDRRDSFAGVPYFPYDPAARVTAELVPAAERRRFEVPASTGPDMAFIRVGTARFELGGRGCELEVYWLDAYGGGLFVPVADGTSGSETYGGGRYLLDTVKGADLGTQDGRLVIDFNLAYNPSCAYDPRWACPLTPPANRLSSPVRAGERTPEV
jgi:uncharacterized protein